MTLIVSHPWLAAFYIAAAVIGILTSIVKLPRILGLFELALHAAAIISIFYVKGEIEDVLLFLIFSAAVSLLSAYIKHAREEKK